MTLTALVAFYFIHLAAAVAPGPAVLMAARTALRDGMLSGACIAVGLGLGACLWALAALFGLALLFQVAPFLLIVLKVVGGLYLGYLAYKIWKHAPEPMETEDIKGHKGLTPPKAVWLGIKTQLASPKPALFFGTIFLGLIPEHPPVWVYLAVLGIIFFNDCVWNIIVSRIFSLERTRRAYLNLKTSIDRIFGVLLAALSAKLVLS
ncbi:threonine/homoserine/homoserine lactone efflux protein [Pacificibacter maritimus]|uniref:Threonine/homoserine/homoserine lactone efflux protein n=1 Tax=Pacificibacter maritimus TaxID=762213 RepID=A0A3N4USW9_9RHOB|nr:LysE family translocator [Pacificibacter maritimus]RPE71805.1 threonine/homoserine/homoserine lactone efflux protein [Pacificibacter maritimus]